MSKIVRYCTLATLVALALPITARADHGRISSADDLHVLFAGATGSGTSSRGSAYVVKFSADGSATVKSGSNFSDRGKWTIESGTYCAQWTKVRGGKKGCFEVSHKAGTKYHLKAIDGAEDADVEIVK